MSSVTVKVVIFTSSILRDIAGFIYLLSNSQIPKIVKSWSLFFLQVFVSLVSGGKFFFHLVLNWRFNQILKVSISSSVWTKLAVIFVKLTHKFQQKLWIQGIVITWKSAKNNDLGNNMASTLSTMHFNNTDPPTTPNPWICTESWRIISAQSIETTSKAGAQLCTVVSLTTHGYFSASMPDYNYWHTCKIKSASKCNTYITANVKIGSNLQN